MDPRAIEQAKERLEKVKTAVSALRSSASMKACASAWTDFLLAANAVYTKLEEGSHCDGRSKAWFGRMKHERRKDELLNYIHHARNSDEHGIEPIAERQSAGLLIAGTGRYKIDLKQTPGASGAMTTDLKVEHYSGEPPEILINKCWLKMLPVRSLQKDWFQPPTMHLGMPLVSKEHARALDIAQRAEVYLGRLIEDGAKYAK